MMNLDPQSLEDPETLNPLIPQKNYTEALQNAHPTH